MGTAPKYSSWNYRILMWKNIFTYYQIHEVYYNGNDEITDWSADAVTVGGDTLQELYSDLEMQKEAFDKPVLVVTETDDGIKLVPHRNAPRINLQIEGK